MHCDEAAALGLLRYVQEEIFAKCNKTKDPMRCVLEVIEDIKSNIEVVLASKIARSLGR